MTNFPLWSGLGLVAALEARVSGRPPDAVTGVSIDTRTLEPGDLFVAIKGEHSDGHAHVRAAFDKGAAAAIVSEDASDALIGAGALYIVRDDGLAALQRLGRAARARGKPRIAAVTGSVGKTSTKEALRLVLAGEGATHASIASYNNHWGVPLTLARMPRETRFGVFEIGMNHAGEITPLTALVRPHVALVTNVAEVHIEHFASIEGIADAKGEIFSGITRGGVAVINRDSGTFERVLGHAKDSPARHIVTFGEHEDADARLIGYEATPDGAVVTANVLGRRLTFLLGASGRHLAINALAVLLAAKALGVEVEAAAHRLEGFRAGAGRGARVTLQAAQGPFTLIDESYNANPASMRAALAEMAATPLPLFGRRIAVLGDMLELGAEAPAMHARLAADIAADRIDAVFAAGPLMRALYDALPAQKRAAWEPDAARLEGAVLDAVQAGDIVMVKGSNGSRMGPIVKALASRYAPHAAEG